MSETTLSDAVGRDGSTISTQSVSAGVADAVQALDGVQAPAAPLRLLDDARTAVATWQAQIQDSLVAAQHEIRIQSEALDATRSALNVAQAAHLQLTAEYQQLAAERDTINAERQQLQTALAALRVEHEAVRGERDSLRAERDEVRAERDTLRAERDQVAQARDALAAEREQLSADRDRWRTECDRNLEECRRLQAHLDDAAHRNTTLNSELLELYRDLRAEDLPTLILRIGMKLTDSENGLYVDGGGQTTIAAIGMDDLPAAITEALHDVTREAAHGEEPVVRNDSDSLPGGSNLMNVAALPVAVQGGMQGVLLVANKRSGPYTEEDTELLLSIGNHAGIALENHRLHCRLAESYLSTIAVLADAIEAKDPYTRGHCESVARIAVGVAQKLGWQDDALEHIRYAALLHDIGKIGIPDGILLKPGRLLPEEYQVIQRHASIGSDLVSRVPSLEPIAHIILHHHERVDGSGYPDGQSGDGISLASRIICVVDAFDAMTTPRPYRDPVSQQEALEELQRCTDTQFDSTIVRLIADVLSERAMPNQVLEPTSNTGL